MLLYLIIFSSGVLLGSIIMGLFVAYVNLKDAWDDL